MIGALVLGACTPKEEPEVEEPEVEEPEEVAFEPMSFGAEDCEYGGKVLKVSALDQYTVEFQL